MRLPLALVAATLALFASGRQVHAQCLQAEQDETAQGNLTQRLFTDAAGRPEPTFILALPNSICLYGEDEFDNVEEAYAIQIYSSNDAVDRTISRFVGKTVVLRGKAFGAMTVHHHAPIVMDISQIDSYPARPSALQRIVQPKRGSALRAALLDTARPIFEGETDGPIEFVVKHLNVMGDWAFGEVRLQRPGGVPIDWRRTQYGEDYQAGMFDPGGSFFLLHQTSAGWEVAEYAAGPTDVAWDGWRQDYGLPMALFQR
jgi:Domain of unknown function (DUF4431)